MARPPSPDRRGVLVHDRPADVVVAAQVGQPGGRRGLRRQGAEGVRGQPDVARGEHRPHLNHEAVVVGEVADLARVRTGAEVREQLGGSDDRLGLERDGGTGDPGHRAQHLGDGVHLRLALAVGAQALPDEGDGVKAQHVDPAVGEVEDDRRVLAQDGRIGPVEVPLELVERRPDPAVELVVPREVARREVGEDLGQGPLVGVGHHAVGEDVEDRGTRLAGPRPPAHSCSRATWLRTRSSTRLIPRRAARRRGPRGRPSSRGPGGPRGSRRRRSPRRCRPRAGAAAA